MRPEIVVARPLMRRIVEGLERDFVVHRLDTAEDPEALIAEIALRVRGMATYSWAPAELIDAFPKLEMIGSFAVGYDGIDVEHARRRGLIVTNTPDVLTDEVANLAAGLVLAVTRRIPQADRYVRERRWPQRAFPLAPSIIGRRVGIVGMGRIGRATARRLEALGAEVVWHGPRPKPDLPWGFHPDLAAMARDSFGIVVTCPGGEATRGLVDRNVMAAVGSDGFLVNVSRGSVIDEPAMVEMLTSGALGAAALDVFEDEPNVPEALLGLDNVVLQPHHASGTVETRNAMADLVVENLRLHFAGKPVKTPIC
jgi:hydroxypyruvate reductase